MCERGREAGGERGRGREGGKGEREGKEGGVGGGSEDNLYTNLLRNRERIEGNL